MLPGFAHSFGWAINASGQVSGSSGSASGNSERLVRSLEGGGLQNLGGVGEHNTAWGINASGQVVGETGNSGRRAVLFTDAGGLQNLNTLIDPSLGWVLLVRHRHQRRRADRRLRVQQLHGTDARGEAATRDERARVQPALPALHEHRSAGAGPAQKRVDQGPRHGPGRDRGRDPGALVVGRWTGPDGANQDESAWTGWNGVASFATDGPKGLYTLTVVNIVLSLHTFDPSHSVLAETITVR